jgi:hypothetical protein
VRFAAIDLLGELAVNGGRCHQCDGAARTDGDRQLSPADARVGRRAAPNTATQSTRLRAAGEAFASALAASEPSSEVSRALADASNALTCAAVACLQSAHNVPFVTPRAHDHAAVKFASAWDALMYRGGAKADGEDGEAAATDGDAKARTPPPTDSRWAELCLHVQLWIEKAPIDASGKRANVLVCAVRPLKTSAELVNNDGEESIDDDALRGFTSNDRAHTDVQSVAPVVKALAGYHQKLSKLRAAAEVRRDGVLRVQALLRLVTHIGLRMRVEPRDAHDVFAAVEQFGGKQVGRVVRRARQHAPASARFQLQHSPQSGVVCVAHDHARRRFRRAPGAPARPQRRE